MFEGLGESRGGCETEQSDKKQSDRKPLRLMPSMCGRNEFCDVWNVSACPNGQIAELQRTSPAPELEANPINQCINEAGDASAAAESNNGRLSTQRGPRSLDSNEKYFFVL